MVDDGTVYQSALESLVHPSRGIKMNLMRLRIGTSDFAPGAGAYFNVTCK